jgi:cephalosporin-C deacetylase-like acetyl esterase
MRLVSLPVVMLVVGLLPGRLASAAAADVVLPGTDPLTIERPLDEVMVEGLNRFCRRELAASRQQRATRWQRDFSRDQTGAASILAHRERFRALIGAVDPRSTADVSGRQRFELVSALGQSPVVARSSRVTVHAVRWPVFAGVTAEGLLLVPAALRAGVVALPDADWTPEMFCGLSGELPESVQFVRRLAEARCLVAIPLLISRTDEFSGSPHVAYTNQPHREFIYRQAFEVGRHIIGYEVQKVLAAVDLLEQLAKRQPAETGCEPIPIGVAGVGEGGLLALYSAAIDPRIQSCWISGYFQEREEIWQEPIYRNVWGLLTEFGDAELAGMIAPRRLVIEACRAVEVAGPPAARKGRAKVAAPGRIVTQRLPAVRAEFQRAAAMYGQAGRETEIVLAVSGENGDGPAGTDTALRAFASGLGLGGELDRKPDTWKPDALQHNGPQTALRAAAAREERQFDELQDHVQSLLHRSHQVRDAQWRLNPTSLEEWERSRPRLRDWVHDELIGRLTAKRLAPHPRSRRVLETGECVGYEIVLDVFEDVIASGVLLLPKNLAAGEQRPLIVCQHGLEGTPRDTITREPRAFASYKAFSEELVKRGFLVYAPQNPYRGGDRFRVLQRMSNPLQRSLFSYIIAQHEQTLDWLATLPQVDAKRIAFYGLSYGGKTAMRVPPLVDRYCLSICSGDFTDWPRTIASNEERFSYLFTSEYEIPEWNLAHVASYAELAMLISPRPFMVEEGHRDGGQPSEWVAGEFGKVRRHYDQLAIGDRAELEFFDGPHTIHGQGTFRFLRRHLQWPDELRQAGPVPRSLPAGKHPAASNSR